MDMIDIEQDITLLTSKPTDKSAVDAVAAARIAHELDEEDIYYDRYVDLYADDVRVDDTDVDATVAKSAAPDEEVTQPNPLGVPAHEAVH